MTTSELRLLTVKALKEAWVETVEERRVMIRAFEKTGISLKVDGSEDAEKMKFQGQEIGIPPGLEIWSIWLKIFYQKRWLGLRPKTFTNFFSNNGTLKKKID